MADIAWTGTTDDDWDVATNWVGGVKPTTSDRPVFDHRAGRDCLTNVDRSLDGTYTAGLSVAEGMDYKIGSSGTPLIFATSGAVRMYGNGDEFWLDAHTISPSQIIAAPKKRTANACQLLLDDQDYDITCLRGQIQFNAACNLTNSRIRIMRDPVLAAEPLVLAPSGMTVTGCTLTMLAGEIQSNVGWPTVVHRGGWFKHDDGTITTLYLDGGTYRPKEGTVTTLTQGGGTLDGKTYSAWTITTAYLEAGVADFQNGLAKEPATLYIFPMADVRRGAGVS
jgi:hypothetical protein